MPVIFNEPLSFLQRVTEYMEYSYLLERADLCETPEERMAVSIGVHADVYVHMCTYTCVRTHVYIVGGFYLLVYYRAASLIII